RDARVLETEAVDGSVPVERRPLGARHPLDTLMDEVSDFFIGMGWESADGPEIEHERVNFDALNFGPDHPARQMQDTFFIEPDGEGASPERREPRTHPPPVRARTPPPA